MVFKLFHSTYESKNIPFHAQIKHYCAIIKPVYAYIYAVEALAKTEDPLVVKKERKFLRKILGPKRGSIFHLRTNQPKFFSIRSKNTFIRKRRLTFLWSTEENEPRQIGIQNTYSIKTWKIRPHWRISSEVYSEINEGRISPCAHSHTETCVMRKNWSLGMTYSLNTESDN